MAQSHPTNKEITHILRSVAAAYTLTGANRFRIVAYENAADAIEHLNQEIYDIWQNKELQNIEGIGSSIADHLNEYFQSKDGSYLEKQLDKVPRPVYELMKAPGIGPKKAYKIVQEFNLDDPDTAFKDVKKLAKDNKIQDLDGFGEKSEQDILESIRIYEERGEEEERMTLPVATQLADDVIKHMKNNKHVKKIEALGSLRRHAPTIGDVDLLATCAEEHHNDVVSHFTDYKNTMSVDIEGESKASIMVTGGKRVDLRVVPENQYGSMVQYFTGNKTHNIRLREYAQKKGYSLSEFGIKEVKTDEVHHFDNEEDFYSFLDLDWIPPEIRQGGQEVELAKKGKLPELVKRDDIKGEFHVHSSFDIKTSHDLGSNTIEEMAAKAEKLGYDYLALSEHNPAQKTDKDEAVKVIKSKAEAIKKAKTNIHIFNSLEIDIMPDGELALPEKAFEHLDMCVASIHSSFRMNREEMTKRILKAMDHPKVRILGHPTGRLIGKREEIEADWDEIFKKAKKNNIALEINSWPERLDLPDPLIKKARDNGNLLVIDTDAHAADQMDGITFGVYAARRGWCEKNAIINTRSLKEIKKWITNST